MKVNILDRLVYMKKKKKMKKLGICNFMYVIVAVYFAYFESYCV